MKGGYAMCRAASLSSMSFSNRFILRAAAAFCILGLAGPAWSQDRHDDGIVWPEPKVVTPGATNDAPPSDAIVLFGGKNFDTLYATCGDRVYKRKLKVKGANAWDKRNKPAAPRL